MSGLWMGELTKSQCSRTTETESRNNKTDRTNILPSLKNWEFSEINLPIYNTGQLKKVSKPNSVALPLTSF
jgi:hypothetical protein